MFRLTVLLYESAEALLAVDAILAVRWAISRAIAQLQTLALCPAQVPLCAEAAVVSEADIVAAAAPSMSKPIVLQHATSAEAQTTMPETVRRKP